MQWGELFLSYCKVWVRFTRLVTGESGVLPMRWSLTTVNLHAFKLGPCKNYTFDAVVSLSETFYFVGFGGCLTLVNRRSVTVLARHGCSVYRFSLWWYKKALEAAKWEPESRKNATSTENRLQCIWSLANLNVLFQSPKSPLWRVLYRWKLRSKNLYFLSL